MRFSAELSHRTLLESPNIAENLGDEGNARLGQMVCECISRDLGAREEWDKMMAESVAMTMQVIEKKQSPWPGAASVKFPLITIAALNYHSRAYPALVQSPEVLKMRLTGQDAGEDRQDLATRISRHMNYQLFVEDENWEEDTDRALIVQPIMGCAFKKVYFDSIEKVNRSELVLPRFIVVPYFTRRLSGARRIAHILYMSEDDLYERVETGLFLDLSGDRDEAKMAAKRQQADPTRKLTRLDETTDKAQGVRPRGDDDTMPFEMAEMHVNLDLDGDGYGEPYVVTVRRSTEQVVRIVARYFEDDVEWSKTKKGRIARIKKSCSFVKYPFIPSPDGGFYDMGLWSLLLPLSDAISTGVNQLLDAATNQNSGGGFLGRGVKLKGGRTRLNPGEWLPTDSPGAGLKDNIVPRPTAEPSRALMEMVQLLISYGERVGGAAETSMSEKIGQNTPAGTSEDLMEQGAQLLTGVYKRTYRAMSQEFKLLYELNRNYLPLSTTFADLQRGDLLDISLKDYREAHGVVLPTADPTIMSKKMRVKQAFALGEVAKTGGMDEYQVKKRILKAMDVPDIEQVLPDPKGPNALPPPPKDPRIVTAELRTQVSELKIKVTAHLKALELLQKADERRAKVVLLEAQAAAALAQAQATGQNADTEAIRLELDAIQAQYTGLIEVATFLKDLAIDTGESENGGQPAAQLGVAIPQLGAMGGGAGGMEAPPGDSALAEAVGPQEPASPQAAG